VHNDVPQVIARVGRILAERIAPAVHRDHVPLSIRAWAAPGEPVAAAVALAAAYTGFEPGMPWGAAWSTWWFELSGQVPPAFAGECVEVLVDPGFDGPDPGFQAEGLVYDADGVPVKGLNPLNAWVPVADPARGTERIRLYLEAAANPRVFTGSFLPTPLGDRESAGPGLLYTFRRADVAVRDPEVFALSFDVEVLLQLAVELAETDPRRHQVVRALERAMDVIDLHDVPATASAARAVLRDVLASPAVRSAHRLAAVGHAHIDSAWLWPVRETIRKTARTFANVTSLIADYPELKFACSSAQQYAWVKEHQPEIWSRILAAHTSGHWVPVGGMWVEADANMPGSEALVRQFVHGQAFFERELGVRCTGVWLPDSFGYTAAYPQVARLAGAAWFLTQKLSWNQTNAFPHHTFWWEGIDGTRIFTHFPPVDTYNSTLEQPQLHHAARGYAEHGRGSTSLVPFGFGDGGGGPSREMLERARRTRSLEGSPTVRVESPDEFFAAAREEYPDAPVWTGELYLELHRGTLTSQHRMKAGNRRSEHLLREAELLWSMAATLGDAQYPYAVLDGIWERVLLLQFHDILPGSSIAWVHREAATDYDTIAAELRALVEEAVAALGVGTDGVVNAGPLPRREVLDTAGGDGPPERLRLVEVPGSGLHPLTVVEPLHPVTASAWSMGNGLVTVGLDRDGAMSRLRDERAGREVLPPGTRAGVLQLHPDLPNRWDAWDIDAHYRRTVAEPGAAASIRLVEDSPLRATIEVTHEFGRSRAVQRISLSADSPRVEVDIEVDWQERETVLKAAFPLDVLAPHHSAEIQFGHVRRPTHTNTSWDTARFEVCAHRWVHVGEDGYGVALVNDSTYGHDITRGHTPDGQPFTLVRLSLLRAPQYPDPTADLGTHRLRYAVVPGATVADAISHGYAVNLPLRLAAPAAPLAEKAVPERARSRVGGPAGPFVVVDGEGVYIEAVKLAHDRSGDVIVRLYEGLGGHRPATVTPSFTFAGVLETDLLEQPLVPPTAVVSAAPLVLRLRPFQIVSLRFREPRGPVPGRPGAQPDA